MLIKPEAKEFFRSRVREVKYGAGLEGGLCVGGRILSDRTLADLASAPDGSVVHVTITKFENQTAIELKSENPLYFQSSTQRIIRITDGELVIYNGNFHLLERVRGLGIGALALAIQIRACIEVGIVRLDAYAAGVHGAEMTGYYVWPKLGFDARIPEERWQKFGAEALGELGLDFNQPGWVSDLVSTPQGTALWRTRGQGLIVALLIDSDVARDLLSALEESKVTVAPFSLSNLPSVSSYKQRAAVQYRVHTSDQLDATDGVAVELVGAEAQPGANGLNDQSSKHR